MIPQAKQPSFSASEPGAYILAATNSQGTSLSSTIIVRNSFLPIVTLSPVNVSVGVGQKFVLEAAATGMPAPSVLWQHNGEVVVGEQSARLQVDAAKSSHAGQYVAVFTNAAGQVATLPVYVTVIVAPAVLIFVDGNSGSDGPISIPEGSSVSLSATAEGTPPFVFKWKVCCLL